MVEQGKDMQRTFSAHHAGEGALWLDTSMYEAAPAATTLLTGESSQRTMRIPSSSTATAPEVT